MWSYEAVDKSPRVWEQCNFRIGAFWQGPKILSVNVEIRVKMLLFEISSPNNGNVISMCQIDCVIEEVCLQPNIPLVTSLSIPSHPFYEQWLWFSFVSNASYLTNKTMHNKQTTCTPGHDNIMKRPFQNRVLAAH